MSVTASSVARNGKAQPETVALFVSDVHLQPGLPRTTAAFLDFLRGPARRTRRLYLLGDMFEYWAGDDDRDDPYNAGIIAALKAVGAAGVELFWLPGNRDFLVGTGFAGAAGLTLLQEPHVVQLAGRSLVLVHGDAQCTDDTGYMAFRAQVRDPAWQAAFLGRPLAERKAIIEGMRSGSREAQRAKSYEIMDVNPEAIDALFRASGAELMVHGHTHRPGCHPHQGGVRHVLPDWDCDREPRRGGWLALTADGELVPVAVDAVS
ncbi:UDP-2,3-diacylglucosamine diphosphatase [Noviherbaspirillum aridicola]|uniref:UDP-2,3-diacylglucosamine hydrolase n=1 Tax=Noviherbaspirillum aridicola TaxID=2849687 RepID=A0ABQ4Q7E1_9BURK|nr:UDP-2,3-diacylglucosamine diphosphatase [Noviherbaspirillum aridicola]GIZ52624.1 UDP-2,3-diacylglucosamine hydrolase [Noviherbaspirillum aridicola]